MIKVKQAMAFLSITAGIEKEHPSDLQRLWSSNEENKTNRSSRGGLALTTYSSFCVCDLVIQMKCPPKAFPDRIMGKNEVMK